MSYINHLAQFYEYIPHRYISYGDIKVDTKLELAIVDGKEISLSPLLYEILKCMVKANGEYVHSVDIMRRAYKRVGGAKTSIHTITVHMNFLRKRIGSHRILSQKYLGYKVADAYEQRTDSASTKVA